MLVLVTFTRQWDHVSANLRHALSPCGQWEAGITCCFLCNMSGHYCVTLPTMSYWAVQHASPDQSEACIDAGLTNQRQYVTLHLSPYIPPLKHSPALSQLGSPDVSSRGLTRADVTWLRCHNTISGGLRSIISHVATSGSGSEEMRPIQRQSEARG